jgi:hypothetical protein
MSHGGALGDVQNRYNLRDRSSDRLIDICAEAIEFTHAATVCARLEGEVRASISRTQSAIQEAQAAVQGMLDILDQGRAARGLPPLYAKSAELGARVFGGILLPRQ